MFLTLISRRYSGALPAYWARHFACALDVFALLTAGFQHGQIAAEGGAMSPGNSGELFPFVKKSLCEFMSQEGRPGELHAPIPVVLVHMPVFNSNINNMFTYALFDVL